APIRYARAVSARGPLTGRTHCRGPATVFELVERRNQGVHDVKNIDTIGVVGAGAMGRGIAQIAAQAGIRVRLFDLQPEAINSARDALQSIWAKLVDKGRMGAEDAGAALERVLPCNDLDELTDVQLVVEAIVERLDVKSELFGRLES